MSLEKTVLKARIGLEKSGHELSVLVISSDRAAFAKAAEFAKRIEESNARTGVIFSSPDEPTAAWLANEYPYRTVPLPFDAEPFVTLFLSNRHVRAALVAGNEETVPAALARAMGKRAVPVKFVDAVTEDEALADELLGMAGRERAWDERKDMKLRHFLGNRLLATMEDEKKRQRLEGKITRYDSAAKLAGKLGNPKTILCLGNGPSSEDPRLKQERYDVLFRANHTWLGRADFNEPALVFTGLRSAMRKLKGTVIGVAAEAGEKMLLAQRGLFPFTGPLDYFVFEKLKGVPELPGHPTKRPTSGAFLLAVAVALKPEKLIIAGMDMFKHDDGAFPGKSGEPNGYTPAHGYDHDLACILASLEDYKGELVIFSEALKTEWNAHLEETSKSPGN